LGTSSTVQRRGWLIVKALSVRRGLSAENPVFMSKVRLLKGIGRMFSRSDKVDAYVDRFQPFHAHH
jgi:hypothetical protein